MAATTRRHMACSPEDVWAVLADGWLYGLWVVGASRIRDVDPGWPDPDTRIHHSVGSWPLLLDDFTSVITAQAGRSLRLRARAWPGGEADVLITIERTPTGCTVSITEDAVSGPGRYVPAPVRCTLLHYRNIESLQRLGYLAEHRQHGPL
ncbi:MAG: SRPBCC family protein [Nakamurella sp.]